jgi:zinc transporter ZupT
MWFYPVPVVIAILGWTVIFVSTGKQLMAAALGFAALGSLIYLGRARVLKQWPFEEASA